jgi:hypothetical protein
MKAAMMLEAQKKGAKKRGESDNETHEAWSVITAEKDSREVASASLGVP